VAERELAALAEAIRLAGRDEEPQLLDRLTRLAGPGGEPLRRDARALFGERGLLSSWWTSACRT
jgi:hypothetical protein